MPSYVVMGASRGIGIEFVHQLSSAPDNVVFAIVRNVAGATALQALASSASNIHILQGNLSDYKSLNSAAQEVAVKTGGSLDYLINNAAFVQTERFHNKLTDYIGHEEDLNEDFHSNFHANVMGNAHTINAFIPLLRKGVNKKVITLTSALADLDLTLQSDFALLVPYSVSKAALNMINAKYASELREEGFVFLAISPGVVNTSTTAPTAKEMSDFKSMIAKFQKSYPSWDGKPITPKESVELMLQVVEKFTPADSGAFVSHFGNKQWL